MGYIPISGDPQFNNNMEVFTSKTRASASVMNDMCEQLLENDTALNNSISTASSTLSSLSSTVSGHTSSISSIKSTVSGHTTSISTINTTLSEKVDKSDNIRNIYVSTSAPTSSDGSDGDVWLVYES